MKTKDLREMTIPELSKQRFEWKQEMLNLRLQQKSGQLENPARIKTVRRMIARAETFISERLHAAKKAPNQAAS